MNWACVLEGVTLSLCSYKGHILDAMSSQPERQDVLLAFAMVLPSSQGLECVPANFCKSSKCEGLFDKPFS